MSDIAIFSWGMTAGLVCAALIFLGGPIFAWLDEKLLRLGLWINGIDGKHADEIVEFKKTGKLPR